MKNIVLGLSLAIGLASLSTVSHSAPNTKVFPQCKAYKVRVSGATGKEAAKDVPSWVLTSSPC